MRGIPADVPVGSQGGDDEAGHGCNVSS
jgi:hypothetical protein